MEYNQLCFELFNLAKNTIDKNTQNQLLEIVSDIEKNGITDEIIESECE